MGLQAVAVPNPSDGHVTDSKFFGQGATTPMGGIVWPGLKSGCHDGFDLFLFGTLGADFPGWFMLQTGWPAFQKMIPPKNDGRATCLEVLSNAPVGKAFMGQKTNAGSQHNLLGSRRSTDPILQLIL